ncbi:hypothetical protein [Parabacteroides sp. AM08-6]|uniref:hypothetical protein n=1 Tax=Parabacteroides sp. AM08-6 TaxID=2292053 RepID=UPI000EFE34CD|nr:hypothetical protein [Parabacteroides sp. AM08-6]RHJ76225.1 hypothetical protein DW103_17100 [Parabacteroides sp. AM08-6]
MGEVKVNIGKMHYKMQLFKPHKNKCPSGEVVQEYNPDAVFLAEIVSCVNSGERIDESVPGRHYLNFNASFFDITTEWKVEYNSIRYDINKIEPVGVGLYAYYECSSVKLV